MRAVNCSNYARKKDASIFSTVVFLCTLNRAHKKLDPRHLGAAKRAQTVRAQQKGRREKGRREKGRRAKRAQSKKSISSRAEQKGREITMLRHRYIQGRNFFR